MCELRALIVGTVALNRGLCLLVPHRLALTDAFILRKQEVKHFLNTVAPCYDTFVASIRSRSGRNDNSCLVNNGLCHSDIHMCASERFYKSKKLNDCRATDVSPFEPCSGTISAHTGRGLTLIIKF